MKKIVLAILVAGALVATQASLQAQAASQTQPAAQGASGAASSDSAPTIKDPAEYNAYVAAVQQSDPNGKVSALEAFLTQYPNSVMKVPAFELLMGTYQQMGNQAKVVDAAKRLITADPCNIRGLALLTFLARQSFLSGQNPQENLASLGQYANKGIECEGTAPKPAGLGQADWDKLKSQVGPIFEGGAGFERLQNKDYENAKIHLRKAVEATPNDPQNVYPLALAYLTPNPRPDEDSVNGLFFIAKALILLNGNADVQKYATRAYKNYHGSEEGWNDVMAAAKANPVPPQGFTISKYVPPTPAQQAHDLVNGKTPDDIAKLSFGEWELVLSAGTPEDQDKVWSVIKGKPLQMVGNVIEATSNTELHIAASADDIDAKRSDITLTMTAPIPAAKMPKAGDEFQFQGTPASYTASPFMMQMSDGLLLKKPGAAPAKPPVRRRPTSTTRRKPAAQ